MSARTKTGAKSRPAGRPAATKRRGKTRSVSDMLADAVGVVVEAVVSKPRRGHREVPLPPPLFDATVVVSTDPKPLRLFGRLDSQVQARELLRDMRSRELRAADLIVEDAAWQPLQDGGRHAS